MVFGALNAWAALVYWTGKVTGTLVAETVSQVLPGRSRHEFTAGTSSSADRWWPQRARMRWWNAACLLAVAHRLCVETWPMTVDAISRRPQLSCYDTVCHEGVWCVYACAYYAAAWLDRMSEVCALMAAITWRRRSSVRCLNAAAAVCSRDVVAADDGDDTDDRLPWTAYLIVVFPVVQFANAAVSASRDATVVASAWRTAIAIVAAVASCAPVAAHGTAAALLTVANGGMRSINHGIARVRPAAATVVPWQYGGGRVGGAAARTAVAGHDDDDRGRRHQRIAVVVRLAHQHWNVTELVTGGVCRAYSVDLMAAVLLAAVRVTYVAISVFRWLTQDAAGAAADEHGRSTLVLLASVATQLIAWFGQFVYLACTCDELTAQVCINTV